MVIWVRRKDVTYRNVTYLMQHQAMWDIVWGLLFPLSGRSLRDSSLLLAAILLSYLEEGNALCQPRVVDAIRSIKRSVSPLFQDMVIKGVLSCCGFTKLVARICLLRTDNLNASLAFISLYEFGWLLLSNKLPFFTQHISIINARNSLGPTRYECHSQLSCSLEWTTRLHNQF